MMQFFSVLSTYFNLPFWDFLSAEAWEAMYIAAAATEIGLRLKTNTCIENLTYLNNTMTEFCSRHIQIFIKNDFS